MIDLIQSCFQKFLFLNTINFDEANINSLFVIVYPTLDSSPPASSCSISDESSGSNFEKRSKGLEQQQRSAETSNTSSSANTQYPPPEKNQE